MKVKYYDFGLDKWVTLKQCEPCEIEGFEEFTFVTSEYTKGNYKGYAVTHAPTGFRVPCPWAETREQAVVQAKARLELVGKDKLVAAIDKASAQLGRRVRYA